MEECRAKNDDSQQGPHGVLQGKVSINVYDKLSTPEATLHRLLSLMH